MQEKDEKNTKNTQKREQNEEKSTQNEENNAKNEPFFIVPSSVFDKGLSPYELAVLFYLYMRSDNRTHTCFPSEKGIARACGMGKTTVAKSIKSLAEKGIIEKQKTYQRSKNGLMRQTANNYTIKCNSDGTSRTSSPTEMLKMLGRSENSTLKNRCDEQITEILSPPTRMGASSSNEAALRFFGRDTPSRMTPKASARHSEGSWRNDEQNHDISCLTDTHSISSPRDTGDTAMRYPPYRETTPPISPRDREINKTISNITKPNITISTELSIEQAMEAEKERFSFMELKRECFEILKNERGFDEEYILLLDRAIEHLWFKNGAEYEGRKYPQNELRALLGKRITPDILAYCVQFLSHSKEPIRSPVPYLAKCILGALVNETLRYNLSKNEEQDPFANVIKPPENSNNGSSFDLDDFFTAAMKDTYGFES